MLPCLTHDKLAQRLSIHCNKGFLMKKFLCILASFSYVSTNFAMQPTQPDTNNTELMTAIISRQPITEILEKNPHSINYKNNLGQTAFHLAVLYDRSKMNELITAGADTTLKDNQGRTAETYYKMADFILPTDLTQPHHQTSTSNNFYQNYSLEHCKDCPAEPTEIECSEPEEQKREVTIIGDPHKWHQMDPGYEDYASLAH